MRRTIPALALATALAAAQWLETTVVVDSVPNGICYNPTNHTVYCSNRDANSVSVIDAATNGVVATIPVQHYQPCALAHNPLNNRVYCTALYDDMLLVIPGDSHHLELALSIWPGHSPWMTCINTRENKVYVSLAGSNNLAVYDGATHLPPAFMPVGSAPEEMLFDSSANRLYCANMGGSSVSVIDGAGDSVLATVQLASGALFLCLNPARGRLYVTEFSGDAVWVIDTDADTVIGRVTVGAQPRGLCYSGAEDLVYCAVGLNDTVMAIDPLTNGIVARMAVPAGPDRLLYNSLNNKVYCTCRRADSVAVIDCAGNAVAARIGVGAHPYALCWVPSENRTYVANQDDGTVSVLRDSIPVAVEERPDRAPGRVLRISPNPADAGATVSGTPTGGPVEVRLFDAAGREAWSKTVPGTVGSIRVVTAGLAGGVYLVTVRNSSATVRGKLVVRH